MQFSTIIIHSYTEDVSGILARLVLGLHALSVVHEAEAAGHAVTRPSSFKVPLVFSSNSSQCWGRGVRADVRMRQGVGAHAAGGWTAKGTVYLPEGLS